MKYVQALTETEMLTLIEFIKNNGYACDRMRAYAIVLRERQFTINQIIFIYQVDRDTVSRWLRDWETDGLIKLYDNPGGGRPNKLSSAEIEKLADLLQEEPRSMKQLALRVAQTFNKTVSVDMLKRWAKKRLFYKRMRKSLKGKRNESDFQQTQDVLKQLQEQPLAGVIDVYYFDETGFSLTLVAPYAWQPKGHTLDLMPSLSQRVNVLDFLSITNSFFSFIFQSRIDFQVVAAYFEAFSKSLTKPTWVILDNAPQPTSTLFKAQRKRWEQRELLIKYLPAYLPTLNLIEVLWRFIKFYWLLFSAYRNFAALENALEDILKNISIKYHLTFA